MRSIYGTNRKPRDLAEHGGKLNRTEQFARQVFREYKYNPDFRVWTSIRDLHKLYMRAWANRIEPYPGDEDVAKLGIRQFGALLNVLFPDCERIRLRDGGKPLVARRHLDGPLARRSVWLEDQTR